MELTDEKIKEILETGCPKCGNGSFSLDSTELIRRGIWLFEGEIHYDNADYIDTVSEDYVICRCGWQYPEE